MKIRRFFSFFLLFALLTVFYPAPAAALEDFAPRAEAAYLINMDSGDVLYDYNGNQKVYPASITKVMTALLVLEAMQQGSLTQDQILTCSESALQGLSAAGSTQNIKAGEQMSIKELLYCLLVPSANEASNILAEAVSGSVSSFVELMNQRAEELGCSGTHFSNAHGLHSESHYTTAHDIAIFSTEAMKYELFRTIVSTAEYYTQPTNLSAARHFYNTNGLLSNFKYYGYVYKYAIGIKTGTTEEAGHCLVSAAEKKGTTLLAVIMGTENVTDSSGKITDRPVFSESSRLLEYGFNNFSRQDILSSTELVTQVSVLLSAENDHVLLHPASGYSAILPNDLDLSQVEREIQLNSDPVMAPISAGDELGQLTLRYQGTELGVIPLLAASDISVSRWQLFWYNFRAFFRKPLVKVLLIFILCAIVALVIWRLTPARRRRRYGGRSTPYHSSYKGRRRH